MTDRTIRCLFAWGIVCCGASSWRLGGVGAGEVLLGIASLAVLLRGGERLGKTATQGDQTWRWFVRVTVVAMGAGAVWANALNVWDPAGFLHDALAFAFCFGSLSCLLPLLGGHEEKAHFVRQFLRISIGFAFVNLLAYGFFHLFLGEATQWISRFNGLSANPNQLALYVCFTPFWLIQQPRLLSRKTLTAGILACLIVGWLSGSEALLLAWVVGFGWLGVQRMSRRIWRSNPVQNAHARALFGLGVTPILFITMTLSGTVAADVYAIGGQGDLRVQRWTNGLLALAQSPLFGLGPGAFSGDEIPFEGQEAHNLYIDWMASGGLLGGFALLWFQRRTWLAGLSVRADALLAGLVSLFVFSGFHYVARHPIFWLYHLLILLPFPRLNKFPLPCAVSSER